MVSNRLDGRNTAATAFALAPPVKGPEEMYKLHGDECWICVQTHPHREMRAANHLKAQAYRCFVPAVWRQIRTARKKHTVLRPFFPRYIFTILDQAQQPWRPIWSTPGVSSVIMGNERPKPVPSGVVEALVRVTDIEGSLKFRDQLSPGQPVSLLTGPFADLPGKLEHVGANGRVTVLLEIMGGERRVTIESTALHALSS